jgi:hypothetical protein
MDWQRERDGLAVVVALVVLVALAVVAGGSVGQFLSTALAAFLGVLVALAVDRRTDGSPAGGEPAVDADRPAGGSTPTASTPTDAPAATGAETGTASGDDGDDAADGGPR